MYDLNARSVNYLAVEDTSSYVALNSNNKYGGKQKVPFSIRIRFWVLNFCGRYIKKRWWNRKLTWRRNQYWWFGNL